MLKIPIQVMSGFHQQANAESVQSPGGRLNTIGGRRPSRTPTQSQFTKTPMNRVFEVNEKPFHEKVFEALKKVNRTEDEARLILPLIKDFQFFKAFADEDDIAPDAFLYICQNLRYEYYPEHSIIFVQGDGSNGKGYLIFSGEVSVVEASPEDLAKKKQRELEEKKKSQSPMIKPMISVGSKHFFKSGTRDFTPRRAVDLSHNVSRDSYTLQLPEDKEKDDGKTAASSFALRLLQEDRKKSLRRRSMIRRKSIVPDSESENVSNNHSVDISHSESEHNQSGASVGSFTALRFASKLNIKRKKKGIDIDGLIHEHGTLANTLGKGSFFGERALTENEPRGATIITNSPCEFLIMTKDLFDYIKYTFNKKKRNILQFMQNNVPKLDSITSNKVMENLYYLVEEQIFGVGNYIVKEGESSDHFFLLLEGECEMTKTVYLDQSNGMKVSLTEISPLVRVGRQSREQVTFTRIRPGVFFGEETLFKKPPKYQFSVQVKSNKAAVIMFKKNSFIMRFPRASYNAVKESFIHKNNSHASRIKDLLKIKYPKVHIEDNFLIDPIKEEEQPEIIHDHVELKLTEVNPKTYKDNFRKTQKDSNYLFTYEEPPIQAEEKKPVLNENAIDNKPKYEKPHLTKRIEELKDLFLPLSRNEIFNRNRKNPFLPVKIGSETTRANSDALNLDSPLKKSVGSPKKLKQTLAATKLEDLKPSRPAGYFKGKSQSISQMSELKLPLTKIESSDSLSIQKDGMKSPSLHKRTLSMTSIVSPKERNIKVVPTKSPRKQVIRHDGAETKKTWGTFYESLIKSPTYQLLKPPKKDLYDIESHRMKFAEDSESQVRQRAARAKHVAMTQNNSPNKNYIATRRENTQGVTLVNWLKTLEPPLVFEGTSTVNSFRNRDTTYTTDMAAIFSPRSGSIHEFPIMSPKNASGFEFSEVSMNTRANIMKHDYANETSPVPKPNINEMIKQLGKSKKNASLHQKMLMQKRLTMEKLHKKPIISVQVSPTGEYSYKPSTSFPITRSNSIFEGPSA